MSSFIIPLSGPPETFTISLGGTDYRLTVAYRNVDLGGWFVDIADTAGNQILNGVPMVIGVDLLKQYKHLGIAGALTVESLDSNPATFDNLGTAVNLIWTPE